MHTENKHFFYTARWRKATQSPYFAAVYFITVALFFVPFGALFARIANSSFAEHFMQSLLYECRGMRAGQAPDMALFLSVCFLCFTFLLFCMLLGLSMWGFAVLPGVCAIRGFLFGISLGLLYRSIGTEGFLLNLLVCAPKALGELAVLSVAVCDAFWCSRQFAGSEPDKKTKTVERYCLRFSVYLLLGAVVCAAECFLLFLCKGYLQAG